MLEKAIQYKKEHRKQYYRSQRFDASCRPHGGCGYCSSAREYRVTKRIPIEFEDEIEINCIDHTFVKEFQPYKFKVNGGRSWALETASIVQ